jgi:hypothetical protein
MQFIDVSGVGNSGKSAVVDLLREIDGIYVPEYWFEFDLIRVPGGLLDLRHCLLEDWSPIRAHAAYFEFIDVVKKMGCNPSLFNLLGLIQSTSQRYDGRFDGKFQSISFDFIEQFKVGSYWAEWPYDRLRENDLIRFLKKILARILPRKLLSREVLLIEGRDFDCAARAYLERLYGLIVPKDCLSVVLNNGIEPFNPIPGLTMLNARQIVVTRDPRDVYVSGLNDHNVDKEDIDLLSSDNDGMNKSFLATDDLEMFVKRFRLYREKVFCGSRSDVLQISFESLMLEPKNSTKKVLDFLGIDRHRHHRSNTFFIPSDSIKNVGLWRQYSRKDEIDYIETNLREFLIPSQ